ncbi:MAG TPA: hypothetical protein ENJ53_06330 [Phaeodactylibacter sp.]|nr:hypothetical protein [Phaeodactylibacter sp.]
MNYLTAFGIAFGFSFVGMLPPGMLNMTVIGLSIKKGFKSALFFGIGAALVEFFQSLLVIKFADKAQGFLDKYELYVNWVAVIILVALGLSFLFSKQKKENIQEKEVEGNALSAMTKGITLAFANVLVYAFWLVQGIYWTQKGVLYDDWSILITFSLGIFFGSISAYTVYILLGEKILSKFDSFANNLNKILASIFFVLAGIQLIQILT